MKLMRKNMKCVRADNKSAKIIYQKSINLQKELLGTLCNIDAVFNKIIYKRTKTLSSLVLFPPSHFPYEEMCKLTSEKSLAFIFKIDNVKEAKKRHLFMQEKNVHV